MGGGWNNYEVVAFFLLLQTSELSGGSYTFAQKVQVQKIRRRKNRSQAEAIASAYQRGLSQAEVVAKVGISISGVNKTLQQMNVILRPSRRYRRKGVSKLGTPPH